LSQTTELAATPAASTEPPAARRLGVATVALAILLAWLPLQTPLALVAFQYGGSETWARAILLAKDIFTAALILYLFARCWRRLKFYWFDWAALAYVALVGVYSIVPWLLGSHISFVSVTASARELLVPVELYALGRLALMAGADARFLVWWFLAVAALAAAFTVSVFFFMPTTFWSSTLDLVTFVRVVQGLPNVNTLWDLGMIARFGEGAWAAFPRAVGPFTQPVGTGHYFVLPLVLTVALFYELMNKGRRLPAAATAIFGLLMAAAVVTPISRGSWMAAGLAVLVSSLIYRRRAILGAAAVVALVALLAIPSARYSVTAFFNGTDASSQDHFSALDKGLTTVLQNPLGLGVGQSDQFGQVLASGEGAGSGVGENIFIVLLVSVGPLGCLAFAAWMAGLLWHLAVIRHRAPPPSWMVVGSGAALVGYVAAAMLSPALMRFTTSASVWLVVGLCTGLMLALPRSDAEPDALGAGATASSSVELAGPRGQDRRGHEPAA
jgi:hypothetical protein